MKTNGLKWFFVGAITVTLSLSVLAVNIPNSFTAGQPIKAADVNANFSSLKAAVDTLEALPQITVPFLLTGTGTGIGNATIRTSNTNGGIAAVFGQTKTGASDAALVIGQSGDGPLIKGFGSNGGEDEFRVDSNGTVTLFKPNFTPNIVLNNTTGGGTFSGIVTANGVVLSSDRNAKHNFSSVDNLSILEKVVRLPISSWNYKTDADGLRHIGPMAQDFHTTFGLNGSDDKHISVVDEAGVALAAIQGLNQKLETENAALKTQLTALEARLTALERK